MVAVCFVVEPAGVLSIKVTLTPEAGEPPLVTKALIGTAPGGMKLEPATVTLTASEGAVGIEIGRAHV